MIRKTTLLSYLALFIGIFSSAQVATPFTERFSRSIEGGITIIANNMVSRTATGDYNGEDNNNTQASVYVDIDDDPTTFNSSSAEFRNPEVTEPCIDVLRAFLYWAAADAPAGIFGNQDNQPGWDFNEVKLMLPGQTVYTTVTADDVIYRDRDDPVNNFSNQPYICVKDLTDDVAVLGADIYGNYQVANVEAKEGDLGSTGTAAGWQIVFIYESPELPAKNITLFDGYSHIESPLGANTNVVVDFGGFVTVPFGPVRGDVVIGALEGDRQLLGDQLQIRNVMGNFVNLTAPQRDENNFFNSRITVGDGDFINRNPASTNTLGFDAGVFELDNPGNTILNNASTATALRITSNQETYGLYLLGLAVEVYKPNLDPMLITQTSGSPTPLPGDIIGFNFNLENRGNDNTLNLTLSSNLPRQVVFVPPVDLPPGVTFTYTELPDNLLVFEVADGILDIGSPPLGIDMEFQVKDDCFFLEDDCDLDFEIEFEASFNGATNPDDPLISISTVDPSTCLDIPVIIEVIQPTIDWATAPLDLDRTLSCEDLAGIDAAQLLEPIADKCTPFDNVGFLTLNKVSGTFVADPDCPNAGTYTNIWNFTDACGVTIANYEQTITIEDVVPPTATDPAVISVQCLEDVPAQDPIVVIDEADNCSAPTVAFVSEDVDGTTCPIVITRIYSVTDACGNTIDVTHVINVSDDIAPTASNPLTVDVQCLADVPVQDINVVTDEADNCSVPTVAFVSEDVDGTSCPIVVTRIYSVTDACNNVTNVTQIINVNDNVAPTASNLAAVNVSCIGDVPAANVDMVTDEADNCSTPTVAFVSDVSDGQTCPETITRTYSVTDACNNSINVTQIIRVDDDIAPTADSLSPITGLQCIGEVPQPDISLLSNVSDNCSTPTVSFISDTSNNQTCPETITRIYRVTDACDNSIDVVQTIIINDDIAPQLVSPLEPNISISCGEIPEVPVLEFADNCTSNITVDFVETTVPVDPMTYTLIRTWTVSDDCDNQDVFTQEVSVEITSVLDAQETNLCIEDGSIDLNDFISNTDVLTETWTTADPTLLNGSIFTPNVPVGVYEFTYTYTNTSSCVFTTTVNIGINEDCVQCVKTLADDINVSKLVTPNNDGLNDFLTVEYDIKNTNARLCAFSISLDIYNRWGTKVYSNANYDNTWKGESPDGSLGASGNLPTGTYYYIVKFNDTAEKIDPIQGYILLGSN